MGDNITLDTDDRVLDIRNLTDSRAQALEISAVMLFPVEEKERRHWMLRSCLNYVARFNTHVVENDVGEKTEQEWNVKSGGILGSLIARYGGWQALANATIGDRNYRPLWKQTKDKFLAGIQAGHVAFEAIKNNCGVGVSGRSQKDSHGPGAAKIAEDKLKEKGSSYPQSSGSYTRKSNEWFSWANYKSVAHLWGSYILSTLPETEEPKEFFLSPLLLEKFNGIDAEKLSANGQSVDDTPVFPEGIAGFLQSAEWFLDSASQTEPRRGPKSPLLQKNTAWKILL